MCVTAQGNNADAYPYAVSYRTVINSEGNGLASATASSKEHVSHLSSSSSSSSAGMAFGWIGATSGC